METWVFCVPWAAMLLCWSSLRMRDSRAGRIITAGTSGLAAFNYALWLRVARLDQDDWHTYYRAATALLRHRDIYAGGVGFVAHSSVGFWAASSPYVYPPFFAALVTPFTALPIYRAGELWLLLLTMMVGMLVLALVAVLNRPMNLYAAAPIGAMVFSINPLSADVLFGQAEILLVLLLMLVLLAYQRRRDVFVGLLLGLTIAIKPQAALYGLFLLRKRCWTSLAVAASTGLVFGLGPFMLLGSASLGHWLTIAHYWSTGSFIAWPVNQSARAFLLRAFVGGPTNTPLLHSQVLADGAWIVLDFLAVALWWRNVSPVRDGGNRAVLEYALTSSLILFAAPLSENVNYVALVLPLAVLIDRLTHAGRVQPWSIGVVAVCVYFVLPGLDGAAWGGDGHLGSLLQSGTLLYGLVLTVVLLLLRPGGDVRPSLEASPDHAAVDVRTRAAPGLLLRSGPRHRVDVPRQDPRMPAP